MRHHKKHYKHIEKKTIYNTPNTKNKRHHSGLEISAGHRSLTGKISQFDRQISSPGGHAWPVNFLIKKYVQKWSRLLISMFPKKCMSVRLRHFVVRIRYTASIVPKGWFPVTRFFTYVYARIKLWALRLRAVFQLRVFHTCNRKV